MSILAIDPGYAKCGWAIVESRTARVRALGVILTAKDPKVTLATDRARRMVSVSKRLAELATAHGVEAIAAEEPLGFGASAAVAANQLPWGAIVMLAVQRGLWLYGVEAHAWQHAVLGTERINPQTSKRAPVDYAKVERALTAYVGDAAKSLDVPPHLANHAMDAAGIGMLLALRPHEATRIVERRVA